MRISIVGWYQKKNVGDEAFRCVFDDFFQDHEVEYITPPQTCNNPDIVILGGGAVVSPFYLNTLPNCPRYALGVDLAYESEADLMAKYNFKEVYVRTQSDCEALKNKLNCPVHAIPDLAFYLEPDYSIPVEYLEPKKKTLGVFATDYVNPAIDRSYEKFGDRAHSFISGLAHELDILSEHYEIVLVPCSTGGYGNDNRINLDLAAFMKHPPLIISETISPRNMIGLIKDFDLTICMRFHAHIFSIIAAVPFVSIEFTRKVKLLLKENGLEELNAVQLSDHKFNWTHLREKIQAAESPRYFNEFSRLTQQYRSQLIEVKQKVLQDWIV